MAQVTSEEEFAKEATEFLEANASPKVAVNSGWGEGSDEVAILEEKDRAQELAELEAARKWANTRFEAGFGWITGPEALGGRNLPRSYQRLYDSLEGRFDTAPQTVYGIGLGMVAPTILAHAIEPVKEKYLAPMYRGDIVACQLFSEPEAGSDLAGIQTRAT